MPRLTPKQYLKAHDQLRRFWLHNDMVFGALSSAEQYQIHDYFQPSKDLSDLELLAHRDRITKERPSLPHQAGRALAKLRDAAAVLSVRRLRMAKAPAGAKVRRQGNRHLTVRAVVKPEPDMQKLARALVMLAEHRVKHRREVVGRFVLERTVRCRRDSQARLSPQVMLVLWQIGMR
jgi:hypothetical protein